jgi:hypothetical protein
VKKTETGEIANEYISIANGYVYLKMNGESYTKHVIIAQQWLEKTDVCVDHVNHRRSDYFTGNLRFVSYSENNRNSSSSWNGVPYEYVKDIDDDAVAVTRYGKHEFEFLYFYEDVFYYFTGLQYKVLHINHDKGGNAFVSVRNTNAKAVHIRYNKFKKLYDLI